MIGAMQAGPCPCSLQGTCAIPVGHCWLFVVPSQQLPFGSACSFLCAFGCPEQACRRGPDRLDPCRQAGSVPAFTARIVLSEAGKRIQSPLQTGGPSNFMDRAIVNCAAVLDEAWAWSFDVDVWRAHLNAQTWPEVGLASGGQFCLLPVSKP